MIKVGSLQGNVLKRVEHFHELLSSHWLSFGRLEVLWHQFASDGELLFWVGGLFGGPVLNSHVGSSESDVGVTVHLLLSNTWYSREFEGEFESVAGGVVLGFDWDDEVDRVRGRFFGSVEDSVVLVVNHTTVIGGEEGSHINGHRSNWIHAGSATIGDSEAEAVDASEWILRGQIESSSLASLASRSIHILLTLTLSIRSITYLLSGPVSITRASITMWESVESSQATVTLTAAHRLSTQTLSGFWIADKVASFRSLWVASTLLASDQRVVSEGVGNTTIAGLSLDVWWAEALTGTLVALLASVARALNTLWEVVVSWSTSFTSSSNHIRLTLALSSILLTLEGFRSLSNTVTRQSCRVKVGGQGEDLLLAEITDGFRMIPQILLRALLQELGGEIQSERLHELILERVVRNSGDRINVDRSFLARVVVEGGGVLVIHEELDDLWTLLVADQSTASTD